MPNLLSPQPFNLCPELWLNIVRFLRLNDILSLRRVNKDYKYWLEHSIADPIWDHQIRYGPSGHGFCTPKCPTLHKIRFKETEISGRVTNCPLVLQHFAVRWTSFHLWLYIRLRLLLSIFKDEVPRAATIRYRTHYANQQLVKLQQMEEHYELKHSNWDRLTDNCEKLDLDLERKKIHLDNCVEWLVQRILLLQATDDYFAHLSKH